jgi:hypothetical protein
MTQISARACCDQILTNDLPVNVAVEMQIHRSSEEEELYC